MFIEVTAPIPEAYLRMAHAMEEVKKFLIPVCPRYFFFFFFKLKLYLNYLERYFVQSKYSSYFSDMQASFF